MALTYMQELTLRDRNGNCRCPFCGRYRRLGDFPDQTPTVDLIVTGGLAHLNLAPACKFCIDGEPE